TAEAAEAARVAQPHERELAVVADVHRVVVLRCAAAAEEAVLRVRGDRGGRDREREADDQLLHFFPPSRARISWLLRARSVSTFSSSCAYCAGGMLAFNSFNDSAFCSSARRSS